MCCESGADVPHDKAQAIWRAVEGLKRLDLDDVEEIADFIAFKVVRKRATEKVQS